MTRAALYHRVSLADRGESVDVGLARLRRHALAQEWSIVATCHDATDRPSLARPGLRDLRDRVEGDTASVDLVAVVSLHRLLPSCRAGVLLLRDWFERGIQLVALEDAVDTTRVDDHLALTRAVRILAAFERARHAEATSAGILAAAVHRAGGKRRTGRRRVAVDDLELQRLYHAGHPIRRIVREIRRRGGQMSIGTFYRHLPRLLEEGKVDPQRRAAAVARREAAKEAP